MNDQEAAYRQVLAEYRAHLVSARQKAQEDYDKTVFALSGGAFGISFAFAENFLPEPPAIPGEVALLSWAWTSWGVSITAVLLSFFFSTLALSRAVRQTDEFVKQRDTPSKPKSVEAEGIDDAAAPKQVSAEAFANPGEHFAKLTAVLNFIGGALFLVGAILLILFVRANLLPDA